MTKFAAKYFTILGTVKVLAAFTLTSPVALLQ
ncbi:hypothetical protein FOPG_17722 [Fusarium oxysporum f. sp. conglutinans race 2 54008]|uniref:Uncharacterized protein n=1 Tax=Fusarium oxysporum f. sp. conglutinans race 2 54008 TaxID=1089457 RepID=X0GRW4_FUSOX|nr:hypothetical protein FOPG_17722 [Fusarium oxysporum f. sp. conglutinans race 2 54008]